MALERMKEIRMAGLGMRKEGGAPRSWATSMISPASPPATAGFGAGTAGGGTRSKDFQWFGGLGGFGNPNETRSKFDRPSPPPHECTVNVPRSPGPSSSRRWRVSWRSLRERRGRGKACATRRYVPWCTDIVESWGERNIGCEDTAYTERLVGA